MVGENMLVASILEKGLKSRKVFLPSTKDGGEWYLYDFSSLNLKGYF